MILFFYIVFRFCVCLFFYFYIFIFGGYMGQVDTVGEEK